MGETPATGAKLEKGFIRFPEVPATAEARTAYFAEHLTRAYGAKELVVMQINFDSDIGNRALQVIKGGKVIGVINQEFQDGLCDVWVHTDVADPNNEARSLSPELVDFDTAASLLEDYVLGLATDQA